MIGIDIVENNRMADKNESFVKRILSNKELSKYNSISNDDKKVEYLASRFASKEALFKVFKEGNKTINYSDISILNENNGSPFIEINDVKQENLEISISHEKNYSISIVMKTK